MKKVYITETQFNNYLREQMSNEVIDERAEEADKTPTEKQKEAGNYRMGHVTFSGFKISIENAKGSKRYWTDDKGNTGYNKMKNHYGYFSKSLGHDGDHVDVFLGDNQESDKVYVVDQNKKDGSFDESKVMLGFNSKKEAKEAYLSNFTPDWKGFRSITGVSKSFFKKWLYNGRKQQKPFADYVEVIKKKLNESQGDDTFVLYGDLTDREREKEAKKERKAAAARKAAETRKRKKEEKKKAEEDAFWKQQEERGYKGLFEQCTKSVLNEISVDTALRASDKAFTYGRRKQGRRFKDYANQKACEEMGGIRQKVVEITPQYICFLDKYDRQIKVTTFGRIILGPNNELDIRETEDYLTQYKTDIPTARIVANWCTKYIPKPPILRLNVYDWHIWADL
jgi:hypothetical protein